MWKAAGAVRAPLLPSEYEYDERQSRMRNLQRVRLARLGTSPYIL